MDIRLMHHAFKSKLSKIDSEGYRNFKPHEIDFLLNEGLKTLVNNLGFRYNPSLSGAETRQRVIDSLQPLIKTEIVPVSNNVFGQFSLLPDDYWHYIEGKVTIKQGECVIDNADLYVRPHGLIDTFFSAGSFGWREAVANFSENKLIFKKADFSVLYLYLTYLRKHPYMHAAGLYPNGYKLPDGTQLNGFQGCELADDTCLEVVDTAVLLATLAIKNTVDINVKTAAEKLKLQ